MKVKELIKHLESLDSNLMVYLVIHEQYPKYCFTTGEVIVDEKGAYIVPGREIFHLSINVQDEIRG